MATKKLAIFVRGKSGHEYAFHFDGDPANIQAWVLDGLEVVEVVGWVPAWVAFLGLAGPYIAIVRLLHFKNPFSWKK